MTTERDFDNYIASLPESIRDEVFHMAWGNSWSAECYDSSKTDSERWRETIATAEMITDAPGDYGIK